MFARSVRNAFLWNFVDILGGKLILVVSQIFIARILSPSDFGLFAILTVFVTFSNVLIEGGMGAALIQKKSPTQEDYSTVFYFKILTSIIVYVIFWVSM